MIPNRRPGHVLSLLAIAAAGCTLLPTPGRAQSLIRDMPGYARYNEMRSQIPGSLVPGALRVTWAEDGRSFEYDRDGRHWRYDVGARVATDAGEARPPQGFRRGGPERGRQFMEAMSPDSTHLAVYRDRNIFVTDADGGAERALTSDGSVADRIKYGTASWVYGEELGQVTAMWWSPDGSRLAYYRFDEGPVHDYYLQFKQTEIQDSLDVEAYPKAGAPNPVVDLFVYDLASGRSTRVDIRSGAPFSDAAVGHYVYDVGWSPDGSELTFNRTNRRQNVMEFTACRPDTGACRVVVREEWPDSWVENHPPMRYLADGKRFLWISERSGFANLYLYDFNGTLIRTLTEHPFEVAGIQHVDERAGVVWYTARDGDNPMKIQLHRIGLDGKGERRLTDPAFHHTVEVAPNGKHFVDVAQSHDRAPITRLMDDRGRPVADLATSDVSKFEALGLQHVEVFTFKAADGVTDLYGMLHKPSDFDPSKKYPLLVTVYAGPATNGARETFTAPNALTEYGFLVASLDSRSAAGRGKRFLDAIYQKLGTVEIDDQAAGVRALAQRP
jgi:dipeptidyl-peptidase-4